MNRELRKTPVTVHRDDAPDLGDLAWSLGFLLRIGQIEVFSMYHEARKGHDLRPGEFSVLYVIHLNPGIRQGVLGDRLRIKRAHMTKLIRSFETRGLVDRVVPDDDRRSICLALTPAGESFIGGNAKTFFDHAATETDRIDPDDARELVRLLRKFIGLEEDA